MHLYSFKAPHGNFGDDLNAWLWPRVFGADITRAPGTTFIGIGSILDRRIEALHGRKVVFGTGVRSTHNIPERDGDLQIRFVRGPISAAAVGKGTTAITDPAILVAAMPSRRSGHPTRAVGFMPHYHSLRVIDWPRLCSRLGFVFIDPRHGVEETLHALGGCGALITEAMHGAIVADALRIPWHRVSVVAWRREGFDVASLKWLDWGLSAGVDVMPTHVGLEFNQTSGWLSRAAGLASRPIARRRLTESLASLRTGATYQLSADDTHNQLLARVTEQVDDLRAWLKERGDD
jgi:succinoglycan biosynthesis protein ExoV